MRPTGTWGRTRLCALAFAEGHYSQVRGKVYHGGLVSTCCWSYNGLCPATCQIDNSYPSMLKTVIRFGIRDDNGLRAATWRLWSERSTSDVYLTCRELKNTFKASLHQSGSWHVAYSLETFTDDVHGAIATQRDRYLERWPRPASISLGIILAFRIVTPHSAVTSPTSATGKNIIWIPNCTSPYAIEADILCVSPTTRVSSWPGRRCMGTSLIGSYDLPNGESVWAVYRVVEMPDLSAVTGGHMQFYKGRSEQDLKSANLREFVSANEADGSRVIYDCA